MPDIVARLPEASVFRILRLRRGQRDLLGADGLLDALRTARPSGLAWRYQVLPALKGCGSSAATSLQGAGIYDARGSGGFR
jgi:hypothetical protein